MATPSVETQSLGQFREVVQRRLAEWEQGAFSTRYWAKDASLWAPPGTPEISDRLGWLTLPEQMRGEVRELQLLASVAREEEVRHLVVLGMGGSSLAPEVFAQTFGSAPGFPEVTVVDTTHPLGVSAARKRLDLARTWFVVSSKSGTTLETLSLFRYFWDEVGAADKGRGGRFIAVTDPGTPLTTLAKTRKFRRVVLAPPDVGGRFSALTGFGLAPASFLGLDLPGFLDRAAGMAARCGPATPAAENPGLVLGAVLGELGRKGVDKVTMVASPSLSAFPIWVEQLIAESTGKTGRGLVPISGEPLRAPEFYGRDRLFVSLHANGDPEPPAAFAALEAAGRPTVRLETADPLSIGAEMFRWEFAIGASAPLLGIHPFDQPDVEFAKELARQAMAAKSKSHTGGDSVPPDRRAAVQSWAAGAREPMYIAVQAYVAPSAEIDALLGDLREALRNAFDLPISVGYGPRYLHSTGQLQKGGPSTDLCLQMFDQPPEEVPVPETTYSFRKLIRAQADGDAEALTERGRRLLRVDLGSSAKKGLETLVGTVAELKRSAPD